jgi:hypothetical protein
MFHNQYIGKETLVYEYKEFTCYPTGLPVDLKTAEELIKSSKWIYNDLIIKNIKKYLRNYVPKYTVAFMDRLSEASYGELYIGVNDKGVVQGIPFQGILSEEMIKEKIKSVINKYVIYDDNKKQIIIDSVSFELLELEYIETELPPIHHLLEKYYQTKNEYDLKEQEFSQKFSNWYSQLISYKGKLVELFNLEPTRTELYEYIKKINPDSNVLKMIDDGYQLEPKTHEQTQEKKGDENNPSHWVCRWKDETLENLKLCKPIPNYRSDIAPLFNPINIITKLSCMIPWWMQKNENMKLYVIKITIKKPQDISNIYYLDIFNKINRCYRTIVDNNPCCVPV